MNFCITELYRFKCANLHLTDDEIYELYIKQTKNKRRAIWRKIGIVELGDIWWEAELYWEKWYNISNTLFDLKKYYKHKVPIRILYEEHIEKISRYMPTKKRAYYNID